jgi:Na+-transporting methylmalonyl-CoA/oxaloacetate decarboxylase gamma subunit
VSLSDALVITGLGMAVVFSGLLLTAGLIVGLGWMQRPTAAPKTAPEPGDPVPPAAPAGPAVEPEILTVITAVLEVERRLHRIRSSGESAHE